MSARSSGRRPSLPRAFESKVFLVVGCGGSKKSGGFRGPRLILIGVVDSDLGPRLTESAILGLAPKKLAGPIFIRRAHAGEHNMTAPERHLTGPSKPRKKSKNTRTTPRQFEPES